MQTRKNAVKGSLLLASGEAVVFVASLLRNMILARLLTKADFGIAATFSMIIALLEFSAKMGIPRFLIRDKDGDSPEFMATAHLVQVSVGILSGLLIVIGSKPLTTLFGIQDQVYSVMLLALLPIVRALEHLDVRRFERNLQFGPSVCVETIPQLVMVALAWPIAKWIGNYNAVLMLLLGKTAITCIASHFFAKRAYLWLWDTNLFKRILSFSWPLIINGFMMFGVVNGEQFLVAKFYSMSDLGPFAAGAALNMAPAYFFAKILIPVILPVLAKCQGTPLLFEQRYRQVVSILALVSAATTVGLMMGAEAMMQIVYGPKYIGTGILLLCLASSNAIRNIRIATSLAALAKGDSQNEMRSNGARLLGLIPALVIALRGDPVWMIACTGVVGELIACWPAVSRLRARDKIPYSASLVPLFWLLAILATAAFLASHGPHQWSILHGLLASVVGSASAGALITAVLPELRSELSRISHGKGSEDFPMLSRWLRRSPVVRAPDAP